MKITERAKALLILIGESDHVHHKPTYMAIVEKAHAAGLAGATVQRGIMGYGANSLIHSATILRLSEDMPVSILIVDAPEKIDSFIPTLDELVVEGAVITWDVNVEIYRP